MPRILAIEPDPVRGKALQRLVHDHVDAEVVLAPSSEVAIAAIEQQVPDVILTSALLSPSEELDFTSHFKRVPDFWRLPILTIPPVVDPDETPAARPGGLMSLFKRRSARPLPIFDYQALGLRIEEALKQSRAAELSSRIRLERMADPITAPRSLENPQPYAEISDSELLQHLGLGIKRLRAHRWMGAELPWLSAVKLPWGLEVRLLNISNSGLLIESGNKLPPGIATTFRLWGPNKELIVPGRVVRSRVADVNSQGVKYEAAAVFDRRLQLAMPGRTNADGTPAVLGELVDRIREEAGRGAEPLMLRTAFEIGIQELVTARDIRIRDFPVAENDGCESIYFTIPTRDGAPAILQATFEPNHEPLAAEFELLKAAANAAAAVLDLETESQTELVVA